MIQTARLVLLGTLVFSMCAAAQGAQIAFDSAGDSAYNNGWTQGSNGGFGWGGGWSFNVTPTLGIIGDSTTNGFGVSDSDGDINSPRVVGGRAWGLIGGHATRAFGSPLSLGQTFSIDFDDHGGPNQFYMSSLFLLSPANTEAVGIEADSIPDYRIDTANGQIDTGIPETDEGIHISFTPVSSGVQVSLTPYVAGATTTTLIAPYTGQLDGMEFDANNFPTTPFPAQYIPYINNIAITPEPAGLGLLAMTLPALMARRRRA